jgi:hypothetical protein
MTEAQLARERWLGRYAAGAAFAAALFTLAAISYQAALKNVHFNTGTRTVTLKPFDPRQSSAQALLVVAHQPTTFLIVVILTALALPFVAFALYQLFQATRARRPEVPRVMRWVMLVAPILAAALAIVNQVIQINAAKKFLHKPLHDQLGKHGNDVATHLAQQGGAVLGNLGAVAELAFVLAFIMTCVYAMRVGLLNRAMGYLGALVGILYFLPILAILSPQLPPIIQAGWYVALGLLFLGRLPGVEGGRFPAWARGEAVPWPTAAERRAGVEAGKGGGDKPARPAPRPSGGELARRVRAASRGDSDGAGGAATAVSEPEEGATPARQPHPRSKKRKRKRR